MNPFFTILICWLRYWVLIMACFLITACAFDAYQSDQVSQARLEAVFHNLKINSQAEIGSKVFWSIDTPPPPSFYPLEGSPIDFQGLKGRKVVSEILFTKQIALKCEEQIAYYIDVLATYFIDENSRAPNIETEDCHACQVIIGVAIFKEEDGAQNLIYKNLFLTLDGSWGRAPEVSVRSENSINNFELDFKNSDVSQGQLTQYKYTLFFSKMKWYEIEREIKQTLLFDPSDDSSEDEYLEN